jgi:hypothetical protein
MLTSEEVIHIINEEIEGNFDISNLHRVELNKCLIKPVRQKYVPILTPMRNILISILNI